MESITYEMERRTSERLANLRAELGMSEIENRIASTNLMLKKMNNEMTPITDKGVTVSHLLLLESVSKRVANLERGNIWTLWEVSPDKSTFSNLSLSQGFCLLSETI